jgi:hypothetical protein
VIEALALWLHLCRPPDDGVLVECLWRAPCTAGFRVWERGEPVIEVLYHPSGGWGHYAVAYRPVFGDALTPDRWVEGRPTDRQVAQWGRRMLRHYRAAEAGMAHEWEKR